MQSARKAAVVRRSKPWSVLNCGHGNKETLKVSHLNSQEAFGDSFESREKGNGDDDAQIARESWATQAKERDSGTATSAHRAHLASFRNRLRS